MSPTRGSPRDSEPSSEQPFASLSRRLQARSPWQLVREWRYRQLLQIAPQPEGLSTKSVNKLFRLEVEVAYLTNGPLDSDLHHPFEGGVVGETKLRIDCEKVGNAGDYGFEL